MPLIADSSWEYLEAVAVEHPWLTGGFVALLYAVFIGACVVARAMRPAAGRPGEGDGIRLGRDGKDQALQEVRGLNQAYECFGVEHERQNPPEKLAALAKAAAADGARRSTARAVDAERRAEAFPGTFRLPPSDERASLKPGDWVRLILAGGGQEGPHDHDGGEEAGAANWAQERVWAVVTRAAAGAGGSYEGALVQGPVALPVDCARLGDAVSFSARHVSRIGVRRGHVAWYDPDAAVTVSRRRLVEPAPVRFAIALPPLPEEGVNDSGWVLLCGGEDPTDRDQYVVVTASAAVTVCPAAERLFAARAAVPDNTSFVRDGAEDEFVLEELRGDENK